MEAKNSKRSISLGWFGPAVFAAILALPIVMACAPGRTGRTAPGPVVEPAPAPSRLSRLSRCEEPAPQPTAAPEVASCQLTASAAVLGAQ